VDYSLRIEGGNCLKLQASLPDKTPKA
jgi:serine/threonine-protein kinase RsbW